VLLAEHDGRDGVSLGSATPAQLAAHAGAAGAPGQPPRRPEPPREQAPAQLRRPRPRRRAAGAGHRRGARPVSERSVRKLPALRGRTVVNLFFEDSTRTRISFEAAAKRLSADVINFSAKGSSVSKGESLKDTALTLEAMGADAVVVRHRRVGAPHRLATPGWIRGSVVNAGDGTHEHPTQALLDAFTLRRGSRAAATSTGAGRDRRRRPAQPGGALQRAAAAHARRRGDARRARPRCCRWASRPGRARRPTTSTPCCPSATR
jgi:hypothetical protein